VLIPSRSFAYPYGSLEALVHHEVAHVLIARACGGGAVPRWFNEGLAMAAARTWDVEDRTRLVIEMTPGGDEPFSSVDDRFHGGRGSANRAYALSGAFVRDLLQRHGRLLPANIFRRMREGRAFDEAYLEATGESLPWAERDFYRRQNIWSRWVPWLTSAFTLWTVISILALIAIQRRRARDARKKEEWDREEAALFAPDPRDLPN
jgi:hypothetical protein